LLSSSPTVVYEARSDTMPEAELDARAPLYKLVLDKITAVGPALEPDRYDDAAKVKHDEEVTHVEQRPDRQSRIVITNSRK
jgi:hypothetical protein